jgi:hypothetical protein
MANPEALKQQMDNSVVQWDQSVMQQLHHEQAATLLVHLLQK